MNRNIEVADGLVKMLKSHQKSFTGKNYVPLSHVELNLVITAVNRLRMMERHLWNLGSPAYDDKPPKEAVQQNKPEGIPDGAA